MKYFLVAYDRSSGESEIVQEFSADERSAAMRARFLAEKRFDGRPSVEVVVLGSRSRNNLSKTHARYFTSAKTLVADAAAKAATG